MVLKDSKWSRGSLVPSKISKEGIRNFDGRGKEITFSVNGESVLDGVLVVALAVAPVVAFVGALVETRRRLSPCSSLCPFASPSQFLAVGVFD